MDNKALRENIETVLFTEQGHFHPDTAKLIMALIESAWQERERAVRIDELRYCRDKLTMDTPTFINIQDRIAALTGESGGKV